LIGLYAIGVFISFTLSQSGMFLRWIRHKGTNWFPKALINGIGALVTMVAVIIIAITKFHEGAWLVIIVIPLLIYVMSKTKIHYSSVAKQLDITIKELDEINIEANKYLNRVIVPIESVNKASIRALRYAKTISNNVVAFCVTVDEEGEKKVQERYSHMKTDIPLVVKYSPFRKVVVPLLNFIESEEYCYKKGDMITVILPQFKVKSWWHKILHNHSGVFIQKELLKHKHIVVSTMPLQLKSDESIINNIGGI